MIGARATRAAQLGLYVSIAVLWETLPRAGVIPPLFVPPLSEAVNELFSERTEYFLNLRPTVVEVLISYAIACAGGIATGLLIGSSERAKRMLLPVLRSAYAVPLVVLYPVITVWFGLGAESKIAFASIYAFIPTMLTVVAGVASLNPALHETARAFGATRLQQMVFVSLPASLPSMVAALRFGGVLVIVGVIVAEMLGASEGLGFLITRQRTLLNSPGVYAGIILVLALTGAHELVLRKLEQRVDRFRDA